MKDHQHRASVKPVIPDLDSIVGSQQGLFVLPAVIDSEVGEEIVLFVRETQEKIDKLAHLSPPMLFARAGIQNDLIGSVAWIVFSMAESGEDEPVFASLCCFNPYDERDLAFWRRMSNQSHLHVFYVVGNKLRDYTSFSDVGLAQQIEEVLRHRANRENPGFAEAEKSFRSQASIEHLLAVPSGSSRGIVALSRGNFLPDYLN